MLCEACPEERRGGAKIAGLQKVSRASQLSAEERANRHLLHLEQPATLRRAARYTEHITRDPFLPRDTPPHYGVETYGQQAADTKPNNHNSSSSLSKRTARGSSPGYARNYSLATGYAER